MKKILFMILFTVMTLSVFSQRITAIQYSIGFGVGNLHEYIQPASFRGVNFDYRSLVQPNIGAGIDIGWNVFYEEIPDDLYSYGGVDYSGKQYRYSNKFPILAAFDYYRNSDKKITPFAGIGLGVMYSLQNTNMGMFSFERTAWHFALRPEIGFLLDTPAGMDISITSKYYHGFKAGDLPSQGYFTVNVGIVFRQ